MTTRLARRIFAPMIALSVLLGSAVVTTQVINVRPAFEEASAKASDPSIMDHTWRQLTTTTFFDRTNLMQFIVSAYLGADGAGACALKIASREECVSIVGSVPAWVRTDKFEIAAKLPSESLPVETVDRLREFRFTNSYRRNVYPLPVQLMLQRLLEETFDLKVRRERREIPVWAITNGKKQLALTPSVAGPAAIHHGWSLARRAPLRPDAPMQLVFEASTVTDAADFFSASLDRPVIDRTGLDGEYEFVLEFKPDPRAPRRQGPLFWMAGFDVTRLAAGLDALGLTLESATAPFEVLVIESVQRPAVSIVAHLVTRFETMRVPNVLTCLATLGLFAATALHGQAPPRLEFEVASVRSSGPLQPGARGGRGGMATGSPDRLAYQRATLQRLLMDAYGLQRDQIKGPAWATANAVDGAALFDISARIPPGATKEQVATMLQNLLKDRFKLAVHRETVDVPGYALVVAKGGPKLKASAGPPGESERNQTVKGSVSLQTQKDGFPELFPERNMGGVFKDGTVRMRFRDYPLSDLVQQFSFALAAHLIDRTGLTGKYDFTLEFMPPETGSMVGTLATLSLSPRQTAPLSSNGPTPGQLDSVPVVSSAMEKQLGLKLEASRIAVDTLVIDHAERTPTEN